MIVTTYLLYILISIALTVWVGHTLYKNGIVFLVDVFEGDDELANSVNHLLVVGFYLINFGFVSLALKASSAVDTQQQCIEMLASKIGLVLLVLGGMHFFNLAVLSRIRRGPSVRTTARVVPGYES